MRIRTFCKFIDNEELQYRTIKDSTLVIDGQNYFYRVYKDSGLPFVFGCESDKYADYLRKKLSMFKKANVKCYFVFKGGHEDFSKKKRKTDHIDGKAFIIGEVYSDIVLPIFMKDVYKQVLDEMEFDYVVCQYEAKKECIALAQKYDCPVVSYDIEYCFSGLQYIPYHTLKFNESENSLECGMFSLDIFLKKYHLTEDLLAIFIVLTDQNIFPENHFLDFIKSIKIPLGNFKRNRCLLLWLSRMTRQAALDHIFKFHSGDREKFLEEETKARDIIKKKETTGLPTEYLENGNTVCISVKDPFWFEKGVVAKIIAIQYVNLFRHAIVFGSWAVDDKNDEDSMLLSIEMIKYTYNLMTDFKHSEINLLIDENSIPLTLEGSIEKPKYEASICVFENGWNDIRFLGLFEHFLVESLQGFDFESLNKIPEDARLLMIALIYFSRKKSVDTSNEVYSVLLSYVALSVVNEKNDKNNNIKADMDTKPILDTFTQKNNINEKDKVTAAAILAEYFGHVTDHEAKIIFDEKMLHPLVEFQYCLQNLNYLNNLCGKPYCPTIYSQTYNGTFVYKVLYDMKKEYDGNGLVFLTNKLNPAATVLAFLNGLIETFDNLLL